MLSKCAIHIVLFMMLCVEGKAQGKWNVLPDSAYKYVFQVNATALIKQFLPQNNYSAFSANPFLLSAKYLIAPGKFGRVKLNYIAIYGSDILQNLGAPKNLEIGTGIEKHYRITERLICYPGFDLEAGYFHDRSSGGGLGLRLGTAALLGFEYRITPRVSISTEASLNCFIASPQYQRVYRTGSEINLERISGFGIQFFSPDFINLGIAF